MNCVGLFLKYSVAFLVIRKAVFGELSSFYPLSLSVSQSVQHLACLSTPTQTQRSMLEFLTASLSQLDLSRRDRFCF